MAHSLDLYAFKTLLNDLATAWGNQHTRAALACFHREATYMQPPDQQYYHGHDELARLLNGLKPGTEMIFHHISFDLLTQTGMGEFTFSTNGADSAVHGVVVITIKDGLIGTWREYFASGPADFERFCAVEGKDWRWHGGNLAS